MMRCEFCGRETNKLFLFKKIGRDMCEACMEKRFNIGSFKPIGDVSNDKRSRGRTSEKYQKRT